ncbi:MAG: hypothetical protein U1F76_11530 [Candidatus Competibacteraceae bacterium]
MKFLQSKIIKFLALIIFSLFATLLLQQWVGGETIYSDNYKADRLQLHEAILHNKPPEGLSWSSMGAGSTNTRVFSVYLAYTMNMLTHIPVLDVYKAMDTVTLFITFILLFLYLKKWFNDSYCLIGVFYFFYACVLTYFLYYFHPWDRISLLSWLIMLFLLRENKILLFALVLAVSVTIKYDVIFLPALYWLYNFSWDNWKKTTPVTLGLFAISFGVFGILTTATSSATENLSPYLQLMRMVKSNYWDFMKEFPGYPPLLVFAFPVLLSITALPIEDKFMRACTFFGMMLFIPLFLQSHFHEVRAEMPVLILLLPSALMTLHAMLEVSPSTLGEPGKTDKYE